MNKFSISVVILTTFINFVTSHSTVARNLSKVDKLETKNTVHISPEIINELKDFKNLIPEVTVDEIVAEHLLLDGNFRTALKYLRSQEFVQLQQELLSVPEIIDVLEFLHLTIEPNATTRHMGATEILTQPARVKASLDEHNDDVVADSNNGVVAKTTKTATIISQPSIVDDGNFKNTLSYQKFPKRPQQLFHIKDNNNNYNNSNGVLNNAAAANAISQTKMSDEEELLVRIVLLEDLEVESKIHNRPHHKCSRQRENSYHSKHGPLGTFTSFVEEILQHLPNSAYQNMIKEKCNKSPQFSQFYKALRSLEFKPLIETIKNTDNIKNTIKTLGSHEVDVNSLEPIAFKVISWGPNI